MKKVKKYLKDYEKDFNVDINLEELKSNLEFVPQKKKTSFFRTLKFKIALTTIVTIILVVPLTVFLTLKISTYLQPEVHKQEDKYLEDNFEKHIAKPIQTEFLLDEIILSFYYAKNKDDYYLVVYTDSQPNYLIKFNIDGIEFSIDTNKTNLGQIKIDNSKDTVVKIKIYHGGQELLYQEVPIETTKFNIYLK
ncbi:MAG: hypothetical protein ACOX56_02905 [Acholeplasmataceae bacterium]|jgi:hypothetical protein